MYNSDGLIVVGGGGITAGGLAYTGASSISLGVLAATMVLCGLILVRLVASRHPRKRP